MRKVWIQVLSGACALLLAGLMPTAISAGSCSSYSGNYNGSSGTWYDWSSGGGTTASFFVPTGGSVVYTEWTDGPGDWTVQMTLDDAPGSWMGNYNSHNFLPWFCVDACGGHEWEQDASHSHVDSAYNGTNFAYSECRN